MTTPFFPPGTGQGQPQPQQAPQLVRGGDGQLYAQTPQGLVPVNVTQAAPQGDPSRQPAPQQQQPQPGPNDWNRPPQQQQQAPAQQQPNGANMAPDTVLRGPGIPAWMQGRTVAEVSRMIQPMEQAYIREQQARQGQGNGQQQAAPQVAPQQPNGQAQQMDPRAFYANPVENTKRIVEEALRETLGPMLQPMLQQQNVGAAERAQQQFLSQYPEAAQYMQSMAPHLQQLSPEMLAKPETWVALYRYVLGDTLLNQQNANGYNPPQTRQQPAQQQPFRENMNGQFFTESSTPSPQQIHPQAPSAATLTPWELNIARASGQTPEQYALSKAQLATGQMPSFGGQNVQR